MICADAICVYLLMMKCALQFALENPVVILVLTIIISFTVTSSDVISPLDVTYQCIRNISYIFEKKKITILNPPQPGTNPLPTQKYVLDNVS